jgi:hypothetical protein
VLLVCIKLVFGFSKVIKLVNVFSDRVKSTILSTFFDSEPFDMCKKKYIIIIKNKNNWSNHIKPRVPSPYSHCLTMIKYCQINSPFSSFASVLQPCHITRNKITLIPSWNRGVSFMPNLSSFPLHRHSSLITKNCTRKK